MRKDNYNNLMSLSKEQLVEIIANWEHIHNMISCTLVDESKWHIESKEAIRKIRDRMCEMKYTSLSDEHLGDLIDCDKGLITVDEYRKRVGLQ